MSPTHATRTNPRWRHASGRAAEDLAARHLQQRGCRLIARRFACRGGEIDLIVDDGGVLAFVEVKARRSDRWGSPYEAVGHVKRRRLLVAARTFLQRRRWSGRRCRFDVCSVQIEAGRARVEWMRDAFRG